MAQQNNQVPQLQNPLTLQKLNNELRRIWTQLNGILGRNGQPQMLDSLSVGGDGSAHTLRVEQAQIGETPIVPVNPTLDPNNALAHEALVVTGSLGQTVDLLGSLSPFGAMARDEFLGSGTTSGTVGDLGWTLTTGTISSGPATLGHPGIVVLTTGAGPVVVNIGLNMMLPGDIGYLSAVLQPSSISNVNYAFGYTTGNPAGGVGVTAGAEFIFRSGTSPNWQTYTRDAGGATINTTTKAVVAGDWYLLEMLVNVDGASQTIDFYLNRQRTFRHTTNINPTSNLVLRFIAQTTDGVSKDLAMDQFIFNGTVPMTTKRWS